MLALISKIWNKNKKKILKIILKVSKFIKEKWKRFDFWKRFEKIEFLNWNFDLTNKKQLNFKTF